MLYILYYCSLCTAWQGNRRCADCQGRYPSSGTVCTCADALQKNKKMLKRYFQNGIVHLISKPLVIMASTIWEHLDASKPVDISIISNNCRTAELAKHDHRLHDTVLCYLQNNQRFKRFAEYVHRSPALSEKLQTWSRVKIMMIMILQAWTRERL